VDSAVHVAVCDGEERLEYRKALCGAIATVVDDVFAGEIAVEELAEARGDVELDGEVGGVVAMQ
jgi:hypothetical protein